MKVIMKLCSEYFMTTHYGAIRCPRLSSLLTPGFLVTPSPACFLTPVTPPEQQPHAPSIRLPPFRCFAHIYCPKSLSSYKFIEHLLCWALTDFSINSSLLSSGKLQSTKGKTERASPEGSGRGVPGRGQMTEAKSALSPHPATHPETVAVSSLRPGLPEDRAVSPLRLGLPEDGLCLLSANGAPLYPNPVFHSHNNNSS